MSTPYAIAVIILILLVASILTIYVIKSTRTPDTSALTKEASFARIHDKLTAQKLRLQEVEATIRCTSNSAELLVYCKHTEQIIVQVLDMNKSGSVITPETLSGIERAISMLEHANKMQ